MSSDGSQDQGIEDSEIPPTDLRHATQTEATENQPEGNGASQNSSTAEAAKKDEYMHSSCVEDTADCSDGDERRDVSSQLNGFSGTCLCCPENVTPVIASMRPVDHASPQPDECKEKKMKFEHFDQGDSSDEENYINPYITHLRKWYTSQGETSGGVSHQSASSEVPVHDASDDGAEVTVDTPVVDFPLPAMPTDNSAMQMQAFQSDPDDQVVPDIMTVESDFDECDLDILRQFSQPSYDAGDQIVPVVPEFEQ